MIHNVHEYWFPIWKAAEASLSEIKRPEVENNDQSKKKKKSKL